MPTIPGCGSFDLSYMPRCPTGRISVIEDQQTDEYLTNWGNSIQPIIGSLNTEMLIEYPRLGPTLYPYVSTRHRLVVIVQKR